MADDSRAPVSQSPLFKNGHSLWMGTVSARRGLASALADVERSLDQAKILHNLQMVHKRYIWSSKGIGYVNDNATAINSGAAGLGFGRFISTVGALTPLIQFGSTVYSYNLTTHAESAITGLTTLSTTSRNCMRVYSPAAATAYPITVYCNGNIEPLKIITSTTTGALLFNSPGVWPGTFNTKTYSKPQFCEPFGDRMVYAGFTTVASSWDILISNQGTAEVFTQAGTILATDACVFTAPAHLGPITGIKAFRPSNTDISQILLVGQRDGLSVITGKDTTTYRIDTLTNQYGIINNRCWAEIYDDLVYMTTAGVYTFNSLVQNLTKPSDSLSYDIRDFIERVDWTNAQDAFAVHHTATQEVQFWMPWPEDSGKCKRGLVLNYNTESNPGQIVPAWSTKDGFTATCGIDLRNVLYIASDTGFIQKHYTTDTYNGSQIQFHYVSALITCGNLTQAGRLKSINIITDGEDQKFVVNAYAYGKYMDGSTRKTLATPNYYEMSDISPGTTRFPWILGTSCFPMDHLKVHTFSPIGRGRVWEVEIQSGPAADNGLDYSSINFTISIGGFVR